MNNIESKLSISDYIETRLAITTYQIKSSRIGIEIDNLGDYNRNYLINLPINCDIEIVDENGQIIDKDGSRLYFEIDDNILYIDSILYDMEDILDVITKLRKDIYRFILIKEY